MLNKKELIYYAVIDLFKNKANINNIKISDIAKSANMGKGTVYEYFRSKDEIISETILYIIEENTNKITSMFNHNQDFKINMLNHIKILLELILENSKFHSIFMSGEMSSLFDQDYEHKLMNKIMETKKHYFQILKTILNKGVEENKFNKVLDPYIFNAIGNTIFTSIMYYIHECNDNLEVESFIEKVYNLILKMVK